jgi:GNAT superfamily N-acetyltransferase
MSTDAASRSRAGPVSLVPDAGADGATRFTVVRDGRPVGWILFTPDGTALRMTGDVRPDSRGAGVATAAVGCACEAVRRGGGQSAAGAASAARTLEAVVPASAGAAHRVLEANGFTCADVTGDPLVFTLTL